MMRLPFLIGAPVLFASAALAATDPHAGHAPAAQDPRARHVTAAPATDPHARHTLPSVADDPHAGETMPQLESELAPDDMPVNSARSGVDLPVGSAPSPPPPEAPLADAVYGPQRMERARAKLREEHGGAVWSKVMANRLELRPGSGRGGYAWDGEFRYGGDLHRFVGRTEGEGRVEGEFQGAEVQGVYSRAIGPYFDVQAGVRHDFWLGPDRTYATVGVEGLAPYWFDIEGALFLSDAGDLTARLEASYDLRFTQRLIVQPSAELDLSAQHVPAMALGSGLSSAELGLRLRYEARREFAPYVGLHYEAKLGESADLARAAGEELSDLRVVVGLRVWF